VVLRRSAFTSDAPIDASVEFVSLVVAKQAERKERAVIKVEVICVNKWTTNISIVRHLVTEILMDGICISLDG